jgi:hypothetical protein
MAYHKKEMIILSKTKKNNLIAFDHQLDIVKSQYNMFLEIPINKNNKQRLINTMLFITTKDQGIMQIQDHINVKQEIIVNAFLKKTFVIQFKVTIAM